MKEIYDQKNGKKKFEEISKKLAMFKQTKYGMLLWLMKYSRPFIVNIDYEKVVNGAAKMDGKYFKKIIKHVNESKEKKMRYSLKREKMKELMINYRTLKFARSENNKTGIFTKILEHETNARRTTRDGHELDTMNQESKGIGNRKESGIKENRTIDKYKGKGIFG